MIDRLTIRCRPAGWPVMYQVWGKLLFLHWPVPEEVIRPLVPGGLAIDTFAGQGWVSVAPFTMWGIRPPFLPALPLLSASHELNVRTYVHRDGVPGIWFLSLDASHPLLVWGARRTFSLPYFAARMRLEENGQEIQFCSRRKGTMTVPADFDATWFRAAALPEAAPESLEFFLVERYCLYADRQGTLYRARIHHPPWRLRAAVLLNFQSTMLQSHGLPIPSEAPLLHAQAEPLHVAVWPLKRV